MLNHLSNEHFPQAEIDSRSLETVYALGHLSTNSELLAEKSMSLDVESKTTVMEQANYQGNWMLAQQERKAKYENFVDDSLPNLKVGIPGVLDKASQFQDYHRELSATFSGRSEHVYSAVGYAPAIYYGLNEYNAGRGGIGERGTVFTDATTKNGTLLTDRQKDIIAAHEAYHGIITAPSSVRAELGKAFDSEVYYKEIVDVEGLKQPGYLQNPDEQMARMAQLKNYFGLKGEEEFTKDHLDYVRTHYVEDTGLDNSMSVMFRIISPKTEPDFLRLMNTLPI